jgi:hypothetical protein
MSKGKELLHSEEAVCDKVQGQECTSSSIQRDSYVLEEKTLYW